MRKKLLSLLMALCLVVTLLPVNALAADDSADLVEGSAEESAESLMEVPAASADETVWDGTTVKTDWYEDGGTEFTITTAAQLAGLAKLVNEGNTFSGKTIKLGANIDLAGKDWTPIGKSGKSFSGTFDGNKNIISNMTINSASDRVGLFGQTSGATLIGITLENAKITSTKTGDAYVGGIIGEGFTGKIENCTVNQLEISAKGAYVGGISGQGYAKITNCTVENSRIESSGWKIGGIIGQLNEGIFTFTNNKVQNSTISSTSGSGAVGGIAGFCNYGNKTFSECSVVDTVIKAKTAAGGVIGSTMSNGETAQTFEVNDCQISGVTFEGVDGGKITKSGGIIGAKYWRGLKNATIEMNNSIVADIKVDAAEGSTVGVLFGEAASTCSYNVVDSTVSVTEGVGNAAPTLVANAAQGSTITIKDSDTEGNKTTIDPNYVAEANQYVTDPDKILDPDTGTLTDVTADNAAVTMQIGNEEQTGYKTLSAAIDAANGADGTERVTVTIRQSGTYAPFTITRANVTVQAAEGVNATIKVSHPVNFDDSRDMKITATGAKLKNLNFVTDNGSSILYYDIKDDLTLDGCTFTNNSDTIEGTTALWIHEPNIEIKNCIFTNWERGYYTCGDNHAAGKMTFTGNTFTNVRVPIDGYWGKPVEEGNSIQITGNTIDPGTWGTSYIQLWDYAQYQYWLNGDQSNLNPDGKTALNATISGNTYNGDVVIYATHCNWFSESGLTMDQAAQERVKYRVLVELENATSATVTNADGSPITAFNENTTSSTLGNKTVIYSISEGDYIFNIKPTGFTEGVVTKKYKVVPTTANGEVNKITVPSGSVNVAKVGNTEYTTLSEAIQAAMNGDNKNVELLTDITVDSWTQIWNIEGITLDGKNHKLTINAIESLQNHDAVFHSAGGNTFKNLTIDLSGISEPSKAQGYRAFNAAPGDTFTKVKIIGNEKVNYGITVSGTKDGASESITIENCEFTKCNYGVYSDEVTDLEKLTITGSKFTDCKYATILYTENSAFTNNMVDSGKLNIMSDKQTVTGNTFTDGSRIKFYDKPAVFEKNNISGSSKLDANTGVTGIDVSENYWGGGAPSKEQINNVIVTGNDVYYKDPSMDPEDLNTYVPSTGGGSYEPSGDYVVSVDKTVGGKVTVNPGRADKGDTVTITVKPDKGYELDSLTVTAKDGGAVKLTEKSNGKFTFKMPGSKVTVEAVFVKENSEKPAVTLPFADVNKGDWFYDAVEYVYGNDLMNGTSAAAFSPYLTTSRAMMLTMLARYDGVDTTSGSTWYEAGAVWAVSKGISDGTNLEADLTREQLVTMLWRYAGSPVVESGLSAYPDGGSVSDWAVNAMIWATGEGVITGNGAGALNPQGTATRAEVATILARFCAMEG